MNPFLLWLQRLSWGIKTPQMQIWLPTQVTPCVKCDTCYKVKVKRNISYNCDVTFSPPENVPLKSSDVKRTSNTVRKWRIDYAKPTYLATTRVNRNMISRGRTVPGSRSLCTRREKNLDPPKKYSKKKIFECHHQVKFFI